MEYGDGLYLTPTMGAAGMTFEGDPHAHVVCTAALRLRRTLCVLSEPLRGQVNPILYARDEAY